MLVVAGRVVVAHRFDPEDAVVPDCDVPVGVGQRDGDQLVVCGEFRDQSVQGIRIELLVQWSQLGGVLPSRCCDRLDDPARGVDLVPLALVMLDGWTVLSLGIRPTVFRCPCYRSGPFS